MLSLMSILCRVLTHLRTLLLKVIEIICPLLPNSYYCTQANLQAVFALLIRSINRYLASGFLHFEVANRFLFICHHNKESVFFRDSHHRVSLIQNPLRSTIEQEFLPCIDINCMFYKLLLIWCFYRILKASKQ